MDNTNFAELWLFLSDASHATEMNMDTLTRKRTGSYYTSLILTDLMMNELIENLKGNNPTKKLCEYKFLEPCVGAGNFVFSYIKQVVKNGISKDDVFTLLDNIYVADINPTAIETYKSSLKRLSRCLWEIELDDEYFANHIGTGLLVDVTASKLQYIKIDDVFPAKIVGNGFDIVATNPPYKNLKAESDHYGKNKEYDIDKQKYSFISNVIAGRFRYSVDGVLNLYKLFVEEIIDRYSNDNAYISLLIPASIMSDKTCKELRTHIIEDNKLVSVKLLNEGCGYVDSQQALCSLVIKKGQKTDSVSVIKDFCNHPDDIANVDISDIINPNTGNAIVAVSSKEYHLLRKLRQFPIVKNLPFIVNSRGELDLTLNKDNIVANNTGYRLIRGRNIGYYNLIDSSECDYVTGDFINCTKKRCFIEKQRIACQQIANMKKERRVTFALVPENYVLGNSCNFISVEDNIYDIDVYTLLGLFNTKIINWLFKLTSSNNHVNNYEIDCFPVPLEAPELKQITALSHKYFDKNDESVLDEIEQLVCSAYGIFEMNEGHDMEENNYISEYAQALRHIIPGITDELALDILDSNEKIDNHLNGLSKIDAKVAKGITQKYIALSHGFLLNHTTFKLSDLDLEMIKSVPPGGSWKDIPSETIEKSKRLKRITQTGGRTTLYGRIDYNKPSYTITTYFNRPGNGTYVHPVHERVLSVREAARFQTFKDDYYFFGNKTQLLKQVGNAVPTLLAYQIAHEIKKKTGCYRSIDLFCGAGGMTAGFKAAGIKSLLCNDIEESACTTLKINNPEIEVLCGDITTTEIKNQIEKVAIDGGAEIICGGPPCQGFSLAGFRATDDPRNQLFREFVDIVRRVNPKIIVFENVEGLLSYQGGKTYREVHSLFSDLGYNTEGRTLIASDFAVPQKRKRVIIICTRSDLHILPHKLFPPPITEDEARQVTARETICDLESVPCEESAKYAGGFKSEILDFFKGNISYEKYVKLKSTGMLQERFIESHEQLRLFDI